MHRNVAALAVCQALMMTASTVTVAASGLIGLWLSHNPTWATLPFGLQWFGTMSTSLPAALLMQRVGRRAGLLTGVSLGVLGAAICTYAIFQRSFELYCAGSVLIGSFNAFGQQYRFAAADAASDAFRSRAISLVLAGGVIAAFAGPNLARFTRDVLMPDVFAASYLAIIGLYILSFVILNFIHIPRPASPSHSLPARSCTPYWKFFTHRRFVVAAGSAMIGYATMNLVMTATPLAMLDCGHSFGATATVIQWHVLAMFAPSFVTGMLIRRFGVVPILATGAVAQIACLIVNASGISLWHFNAALILLGLGWNFLFVGGTTLLSEGYHGADKARAQGVNDMALFTLVTITALGSGVLLEAVGWLVLNLAMVPVVAFALGLGLWRQRSPATVESGGI